MAEYLRTSGVSSELEKLIIGAKNELYIISPYLKLSDRVKALLKDKELDKVETTIIFGKKDLAPGEMNFLENLSYVRLYFLKNLHAKCYLSESKMIISSMNLYEFSQLHNTEMGILINVDNEDDRDVYEEAYKDIEFIIRSSEDLSYTKALQKKAPSQEQRESVISKILSKSPQSQYSDSKLLTTKELSKLIGVSSKNINTWLTENRLMYKKEEDWISTKKGKQVGGISKEGPYGKYIVWPKELSNHIRQDIFETA